MGIDAKDILGFAFFQYGKPFSGSCQGMKYRIARDPMENVFYNHDPHKNDDAVFKVEIWRGPFNYDTTEEEKETATFPFTDEELKHVIEWLNEKYEERADFWALGKMK